MTNAADNLIPNPHANPYKRQELLFNNNLWRPIVIVGLGGIGSWVAFELAKMGARELWFFDYDLVEVHNACYTVYGRHQAGSSKEPGKKKVEAMKRFLHRWEGSSGQVKRDLKIKAFARAPLPEDIFPKLCIVVVAVDDMDIRKDIWEKNIRLNPHVLYLIEARMGAEASMIYTIRPMKDQDAEFYSSPSILYPQSQASRETCAEQSFVYTAAMTGSIITSQVKSILLKEYCWSEIICDLKNMKITTRRLIEPA